jgi:hypothetical protein
MEYKTENKICQNCKTEFSIEPNDFGFYEKMQVPPPDACPQCRQQARMLFRNFRTLYKRKCDKSGKMIVSIYNPITVFPVYGTAEWWGDEWDPLDFGKTINWSTAFFPQITDMFNQVPHMSIMNTRCENCEYSNQIIDSKNCYLICGGIESENSDYGHIVWYSTDSMDNLYLFKSESCYQCTDCLSCNKLFYSEECEGCADSIGLFDCRGCFNCIGCVGMINKSYYIFNKPVSKEMYSQFLKENPLYKRESLEKILNEKENLRKILPQRSFFGYRNNNVSGNHIYNARNVHDSFDVKKGENSRFCFTITKAIDTYDVGFCPDLEECYQVLTGEGNKIICSHNIFNGHDVYYSDNCYGSDHLFGCYGLRNKSYCILNKQYNKDEYGKLVPKLIELMKNHNEWGNFFPKELSPFGYNEAIVHEYIPLEKEEAIAQGFKWQDNIPSTNGQQTIKFTDLPQNPNNYNYDLTEEILDCSNCGKNYRLIQREIGFYKKFGLPIPDKCFNCRHESRMKKRNPRALWKTKCAKCDRNIETSYTPENQKIYKLYCEKCYNQEVY